MSAETQAGDARSGQDGRFRLVEVARIGLDAEFCIGGKREILARNHQKSIELRRWQVRRSAAAEKERIDFVRFAERAKLALKCFQIGSDQVVPARDEREVAVAAAMAAEGDVDVSRAGRCHSSIVIGHS